MIEETKRNKYLILFTVAFASCGLFLLFGYLSVGTFSFPLDDAWIHQTYARNFAATGEWAYIPGKTSGGSTSPLWTLLLSVVHLTKTGPFIGTYLLGFALFFGAGVLFQQLSELIHSADNQTGWLKALPFFGIYFLLDWRMNWAAVSGMEIMLYIVVILAFFVSLANGNKPILSGILVGIALWVRPDALTLLGPLLFVFFFQKEEKAVNRQRILKSLLAFIPFLLGYLLFNRLTAGTWLPNTFYAKQTEYALLYQIPILQRILQLIGQPWISAAVIFLPGFVYQAVLSIKRKHWLSISMFLWASGYILIYAVRLPVIYQHARYLMPTMPVFYFLGVLGTLEILQAKRLKEKQKKLLNFAFAVLTVSLVMGFWLLGVSAYQSDAGIIHQEMVETSIWVRENIPQNATIAAHDIGALGYYGEHDILDLAGLISPEVIPFIRDEEKLLEFLENSQVRYLMTLSDWYETLTETGELLYSSSGKAVLEAGGAPMAVYDYNWSGE